MPIFVIEPICYDARTIWRSITALACVFFISLSAELFKIIVDKLMSQKCQVGNKETDELILISLLIIISAKCLLS